MLAFGPISSAPIAGGSSTAPPGEGNQVEVGAASDSSSVSVTTAATQAENFAVNDNINAGGIVNPAQAEGGAASEALLSALGLLVLQSEAGTTQESNTGLIDGNPSVTETGTLSEVPSRSLTASASAQEGGVAADALSGATLAALDALQSEAGVPVDLLTGTQGSQPAVIEAGATLDQVSSGGSVIVSMAEALGVAELLNQLYSFSITQTEAMTPEDLVAALSVALSVQAFNVAIVTESQLLSLTTNSEQGEVLVVAEIQTTDIPTTPTTVLEVLTAYDLVARLQYLKGSGAFTVSSPERRFIIFSHPRD